MADIIKQYNHITSSSPVEENVIEQQVPEVINDHDDNDNDNDEHLDVDVDLKEVDMIKHVENEENAQQPSESQSDEDMDDNEEDEEDEEEDNELERSMISEYWIDEEEMQAPACDSIPIRQSYSARDFHKDYYNHDTTGLLTIDGQQVDNTGNNTGNTTTTTGNNNTPRVTFGRTNKVFHFEKHPLEMSSESYFLFPNYSTRDDDDDDDDDEVYDDSDPTESDDESDGEPDGSDDSYEPRGPLVYYKSHFKESDEEDQHLQQQHQHHHHNRQPHQHHHRSRNEDEDYDSELDRDDDGDQDDDDDNNSVVSVEEHADVDSTKGTFFNVKQYDPNGSDKSTEYLKQLNGHHTTAIHQAHQGEEVTPAAPQLRAWANRPQVQRYTPRFTQPRPQLPQSDNSDEDEDEAEESEEDEVDVDDEDDLVEESKLNEIKTKRSLIEKELQEYRQKTDHERRRLRDCFAQAKQNLKEKIEQASSLLTSDNNSNNNGNNASTNNVNSISSNKTTSHSSSSSARDLVYIENQTMKDELDDVLLSLSQLQHKINDMELSLGDDPRGAIHKQSTDRQQRKELMLQDRDLEDITKQLLDMALQVSSSVLYKPKQQQHQPAGTTTTSTTSDDNTSSSRDIEFYRNQVEALETRLGQWKHHNEVLHIELLMDKQNSSQEFLNMSNKIQKVEEERDRMCSRIDQLVAELSAMEGRESVLSSMVNNLMGDKEALAQTILDMDKDRAGITERFNHLILELRVTGESACIQLQEIIDALTLEREELQSEIRGAQEQRGDLITKLETLNVRLFALERDNTTLVTKFYTSEQSNSALLQETQRTVKLLEASERECAQLQNQLQVVNKRLMWAESEVDRLTKEMNRLLTASITPSSNSISTSGNVNVPSSSSVVDVELSQGPKNTERIQVALESIKEKVLHLKQALLKEKKEILQLRSGLALVVEKGKVNSSQTLSSLRDYILREVETTKIGIANKLTEIESTNNSTNSGTTKEDLELTNQYLLSEVQHQRNKLNLMQSKIVKLESQIIGITSENNSFVGDQVNQLMKMESKLRKMEVGISQLSGPNYSLPMQSTTITTTTTTQYFTADNNTNVLLSSPMADEEFEQEATNKPELSSDGWTHIGNSALAPLPSSSSTPTTTPSAVSDTPTPLPLAEGTTPEVSTPAAQTDIKPRTSSSNNRTNNSTRKTIQKLVKGTLALGLSTYSSSLFIQLLNHNSGSPIHLSDLSTQSLRYGASVMALTGLIQSSWIAINQIFTPLNNNKHTNNISHAPAAGELTDDTHTQSTTTNDVANNQLMDYDDDESSTHSYRDIALSGAIGAAMCSAVLYHRLKRPDVAVAGSLLGFSIGGITRLLMSDTL
ncbi:hypothetical protein SAMD00019534_125990 [Acytostelium subglobosum LB1]|uniref:hypothetical protein n=1 Tax=Acytostelium subglobosum LB1 TaxID=1410327 RepID=UPI000645060D|nr:hypothetical protein SAMD00019534_125990 [Acytostelium subglobosum LB1]GAM29423.1 hypothetical protein SAMD00019534_125990 [Acytostelium subglobosum LB1]|eukprot:XP_012747628.1 hypothetical protein SAMD00019534_125990 [Acytostelium subglobosum LB1]